MVLKTFLYVKVFMTYMRKILIEEIFIIKLLKEIVQMYLLRVDNIYDHFKTYK